MMINHPAYNHKTQFCRMQNLKFRRFYIDPIPDDAMLPYPIRSRALKTFVSGPIQIKM